MTFNILIEAGIRVSKLSLRSKTRSFEHDESPEPIDDMLFDFRCSSFWFCLVYIECGDVTTVSIPRAMSEFR